MNNITDERVKGNRGLFLNLTEIGYSYPFDYRCYYIYRTTDDEWLKEQIENKIKYIRSKDKSAYFSRLLMKFENTFIEEEYY